MENLSQPVFFCNVDLSGGFCSAPGVPACQSYPAAPSRARPATAGCSAPRFLPGTAFAEKMANARSGSAAVPILAIGNPDMKQARHFENVTPTTSRGVACIAAVIDDMQRVVILLEDEVAAENERSRIRGYSEAESSILAKALAERSDNLKGTISMLAERSSLSFAVAGTRGHTQLQTGSASNVKGHHP
jgi:hypothetical protein